VAVAVAVAGSSMEATQHYLRRWRRSLAALFCSEGLAKMTLRPVLLLLVVGYVWMTVDIGALADQILVGLVNPF